MKKVIDGKLYDTNEARCVAEFVSPECVNDFNYYEEKLFLTKNGRWFLAGAGNAMSKYSERAVGGGSQAGDGLFPLEPEEALEWLEAYGDTEDILEHFGSKIEDA
jgi:hypothetical protein